jgi:Flp pilus assembly protein TadD
MYMRAAKYEAAIGDFTMATTLNPRHADALAARGAARQAVGQITDAARDYYAALELDPKNRNALVSLRMLGLRPD